MNNGFNIPHLLCPGALTQAIRNFAKSLESWLTNAMMNIPEEMVRIKVRQQYTVFANRINPVPIDN